MPRLIPSRTAPLVVAVENIPDASPGPWNTSGFVAFRGQVLPADSPKVKRHPESFEPAPTDVRRGGPPAPNEVAAVAQVTFSPKSGGPVVFAGDKFYPYDQLVLEHPRCFVTWAPAA
jgi:hypothetical protein